MIDRKEGIYDWRQISLSLSEYHWYLETFDALLKGNRVERNRSVDDTPSCKAHSIELSEFQHFDSQ